MITIRLNGQDRNLPEGTTVATLLDMLELAPVMVVVEVDGDILARDQHPETVLNAGAEVEIVHFVGGG